MLQLSQTATVVTALSIQYVTVEATATVKNSEALITAVTTVETIVVARSRCGNTDPAGIQMLTWRKKEFNNIRISMNCACKSSRQVGVAIAACSVETAAAPTSVTVTTALITLAAIELALVTAAVKQ